MGDESSISVSMKGSGALQRSASATNNNNNNNSALSVLFDFALIDERDEAFAIPFDASKPDQQVPNERYFHIGRGPFLKLDNKHVSRQQVKLSLNYSTGVASVVSLGTNPTTVIRATGGELLLDANQLYAISHNDVICLWRAECRFKFSARLKPGVAVPQLPDDVLPLIDDDDDDNNNDNDDNNDDNEADESNTNNAVVAAPADNLRTSASRRGITSPSSHSSLNASGAVTAPNSAPGTPIPPHAPHRRIDTVTTSMDDDEDDTRTSESSRKRPTAAHRPQQPPPPSSSAQQQQQQSSQSFVSPIRRTSQLAAQSSGPHGASKSADNLMHASVVADDDRFVIAGATATSSSKSGDDNDDWPIAVLHGALLRRLESQAREIGALQAQLAHARSKIDKLDRKLRSAKKHQQSKADSDDSLPTPVAGTSADLIPDISGMAAAASSAAADMTPPMTPELRASRGPTLLSPRGSPLPPVVDNGNGDDTDDDEEAQAEKRQHIINEILSTERDYLRDLRWVLEQYVEPIKASAIISTRDQQHLFSNLASLCHLHDEILSMLEKSSAAGSDAAIGQTFLRIGSYLKVYATYVTDQEGTREFIISKRAESPQFAEHCEMVKALPQSRSLDLEAFLIKPVQRVCQYPLLIEQLLKATPKSLPDRRLLAEALESVRSVANHVNESKRSVAMIARVAQISKSMSGLPRNFELAVATRRFLHEGPLTVLGVPDVTSPSLNRKAPKQNARQSVYCFLFNDVLIEAKSKGAKFVVRQLLMFDNETVGEQVPQEMEPHAFQLVRKQQGQRQTFLYACASADDADTWISHLGKAIKFTMLVRKSHTLRKENRSSSIGSPMMRQSSFRKPLNSNSNN